MSEEKSIKEYIEYYMQNGDIYYDNFFCYDFSGRDACKKVLLDCFQDYVINNDCKLSKCMDETKRIYRNMYSNIRNTLKKQQRDKANDFYLNFVNDSGLKALLKEAGLGIRGKVIRITDTCQAALYLLNIIIPKIEEQMHLKGVKPIKRASLYAHSLIDFSEAEIVED